MNQLIILLILLILLLILDFVSSSEKSKRVIAAPNGKTFTCPTGQNVPVCLNIMNTTAPICDDSSQCTGQYDTCFEIGAQPGDPDGCPYVCINSSTLGSIYPGPCP